MKEKKVKKKKKQKLLHLGSSVYSSLIPSLLFSLQGCHFPVLCVIVLLIHAFCPACFIFYYNIDQIRRELEGMVLLN